MGINQENYIAPEFRKEAFHCPRCNVYAHQTWHSAYISGISGVKIPTLKPVAPAEALLSGHHFTDLTPLAALKPPASPSEAFETLKLTLCSHCRELSFWIREKLVDPPKITAPLAHQDMPTSVSEYYNEAREISASSPRAAAALLRIAAKKLCESLGENESNLNRAIGNLNRKGLPRDVIKSLDTVRIVGNEGGAHEGQIDLTGEDNREIVDRLFRLINFIVEKTITEPRVIESTFGSLPENKRQAAEKRDEGKS